MVTDAIDVAHQPARPSWDCRACDRPWPCDPARERLSRLYTRTMLAIYTQQQMALAIQDMPTVAPAELYERFLSWIRAWPN